MIDLLTKIGIPALAALMLAIAAAIIWRYFTHRLEEQRKQFESELALIQSIHRERFDTVAKIYHHLGELYHSLNHIHEPEEKESREKAAQRHIAALRSLVREKVLILGDSILPPAYAVTDYAAQVAKDERRFEQDRWFALDRSLTEKCQKILKSIPRVGRELQRTEHANHSAEQLREPDA